MNDRIKRLNSNAVKDRLKPIVLGHYKSDRVAAEAAEAAEHYVTGLADWVNSAHLYRHGHGVEEPADPPTELAIALVSSGASYLRWLAEIADASSE